MNYNRVTIAGRITNDMELKRTTDGLSVLKFTVAVNRAGKKDEADFFNCVAFGKTAEFMIQYYGKGSGILVDGEMTDNQYTDKNDKKVHFWQVNARRVYFTDTKKTPEKTASASATDPQANFTEIADNEELPF